MLEKAPSEVKVRYQGKINKNACFLETDLTLLLNWKERFARKREEIHLKTKPINWLMGGKIPIYL